MQELKEQVDLRKLGLAQLIKRNERVAIYKRGKGIFEVFRRKYREVRTANFKGKVVEYAAAEIYPSNEDFGVWAWCYVTMEDAEKKYNTL